MPTVPSFLQDASREYHSHLYFLHEFTAERDKEENIRKEFMIHTDWQYWIIQFVGLKDPVQIDLDWLMGVLTIPIRSIT